MNKIGIYGGSFDPIHHGHLILAREAREALKLDKVVFVPAGLSPHKLQDAPGPAEVRLEMLRAALEGESGFEFDALEIQRPSPSFTIDTIEEMQRRETLSEIFLLIGEDHLAGLPAWHRFEELCQLVQFVVLERSGPETHHGYPAIRRHVQISATDIRNRVATGRSIRYLVPPVVEEIIRRRQLYQEPAR